MTITEFQQTLYTLFDRDLLEKFPNEWGLTTRGKEPITRVGFATNLTNETAIASCEAGVDLLLTHHDAWPFLHGMKESCMRILQEADLSHFYIHLPLDDVEFGTNTSLARRLGGRIVDQTHLCEEQFLCGRIAEFQPSVPFNELVHKIEIVLGESVKSWRHHDRPVSRLCIVTGGGMMTSDVKEAVDHQCDAYLTGEKVLYTVEYARFAGINLVVGSHTYTEIFGVEGLAQQLLRHHPSLTVMQIVEAHVE